MHLHQSLCHFHFVATATAIATVIATATACNALPLRSVSAIAVFQTLQTLDPPHVEHDAIVQSEELDGQAHLHQDVPCEAHTLVRELVHRGATQGHLHVASDPQLSSSNQASRE